MTFFTCTPPEVRTLAMYGRKARPLRSSTFTFTSTNTCTSNPHFFKTAVAFSPTANPPVHPAKLEVTFWK